MAIIAFTGKAQHGKDTCALFTKQILSEKKFEIRKFAEKLKQAASIILGCNVNDFEDEQFKSQFLPEELSCFFLKNKDFVIQKKITVREFLRLLGTEFGRDKVSPNLWVYSLFKDYTEDSNWIISDLRFLNEAEEIKSHQGIIIKVTNPRIKSSSSHTSETELEQIYYDHLIINDGTLENLFDKLNLILNAY